MQLTDYMLEFMEENLGHHSWAIFFKSFQRIHLAIEEALKTQGLPGLDVYDVLWILELAPNSSLRMSELSERVYIAKFNITRLTDRLAKQGLVKKEKCPEDGRGVIAVLTKKGQGLRLKMWSIYQAVMVEKFGARLSDAEHRNMSKILSKLELN